MEKFLNLSKDKQNTIIDAALITFGTNGYKKSSISEIASTAGISKAMIFHYFGTKKDLYLYLVNMCGNLLTNEVDDKFDNSVTDFFDRIIQASDIEISVMKKHPAIIKFLHSMYFETNEEVVTDLKEIFDKGENFRSKIAFHGMDTSKFKDGVDLNLVMKMLMWITDGFMNSSIDKADMDLEAICNEFYECLHLLKNNLYKDEFIT
jgi:TetR/AcrR family transcriptional regulator